MSNFNLYIYFFTLKILPFFCEKSVCIFGQLTKQYLVSILPRKNMRIAVERERVLPDVAMSSPSYHMLHIFVVAITISILWSNSYFGLETQTIPQQ